MLTGISAGFASPLAVTVIVTAGDGLCPVAQAGPHQPAPAFAGDERLDTAVDISGLNPGFRIIMVSVDQDAANRDGCHPTRRRQLRPKDRDATQTPRGNHLAVSLTRTANRRLPLTDLRSTT